jgi:RsiW-degrading membrane proteinase PrsW (M82 family)
MNIKKTFKRSVEVFSIVLLLALVFTKTSVSAQGNSPQEDQELAERYAPVLYFHRDEIFRPQSVDVIIQTARLRQDIRYWFDVNVLNDVVIQDLVTYRDASYVLDVWYGNSGASDYKNYSAHRAYYEAFLSPDVGGPSVTTYAHVFRDGASGTITIQYWLFYYYNDWFNKHEGDWELVQVMLDKNEEPEWVVLSQHHGGTRRSWNDTQIEEDTHPVAYVALGSHANYFWGNEIYPNGQDIGNTRVEIVDRTGTYGRIIPKVVIIPNREEIETAPSSWSEAEWLVFSGHWGEKAIQSDFGGPLGPADKGQQWENPYGWGMDQPLDFEVWYQNRLRVEVTSEPEINEEIKFIQLDGEMLPKVDLARNIALLHDDPPPSSQIIAQIVIPPEIPFNINATWPDAEDAQVVHYLFENITFSSTDRANIIFDSDGYPTLEIPGFPGPINPTSSSIDSATWDAPDLVWIAGLLPASDIIKGVVISLLAGVIPALLYTGLMYWSDRYEKEPKALLATAFFWGAIPALLITIVVEIFFQVPVELIGPQAIEAVRLGVINPIVEEILKGMVILYIARRYRREFDDVLDGIIYGAMVGFGFAMTGNILSYLGAFFLRGFSGLNLTIFIEGLLFGFNQALYSAIFGAGLGYARLTLNRVRRWVVPMACLILAIGINAFHSLAMRNIIGFNLATILLPWAGLIVIIAVMFWSLKRQHQTLVTELIDEIPNELYKTVTDTVKRNKSLRQAFFQNGIKKWRELRYQYQLCAELAFKKMQNKRFPEEQGIMTEINDLRRELLEHINLNQLEEK